MQRLRMACLPCVINKTWRMLKHCRINKQTEQTNTWKAKLSRTSTTRQCSAYHWFWKPLAICNMLGCDMVSYAMAAIFNQLNKKSYWAACLDLALWILGTGIWLPVVIILKPWKPLSQWMTSVRPDCARGIRAGKLYAYQAFLQAIAAQRTLTSLMTVRQIQYTQKMHAARAVTKNNTAPERHTSDRNWAPLWR